MLPFDLDAALTALPASAADAAAPVSARIAALEAQQLFAAARPIREQFARLPDFELMHLDSLPQLVAALHIAEQRLETARAERLSGSLRQARKEAERLRSQLLASARYLTRRNEDAQLELDRISGGDSIEDLVRDLEDLAFFANRYSTEWQADVRLPSNALARARVLAGALSSGADPQPAHEAELRRNQIFALLEIACREVRAAARYILQDDPRRLAPFLSQYADKWRRRRRAKEGPPSRRGG
jgi:hypothetical protein